MSETSEQPASNYPKCSAGKRQRDGVGPTPPSFPVVGTRTRFHIPITARNDLETHADLDSGAEVDLVSFEFVKKYKLQAARLTEPLIRAINRRTTPTYGVWSIPLKATDPRGTTRRFTRACVAIDRDPRLIGSPVLLSMTTIHDLDIYIAGQSGLWWFGTLSIKALSPKRFAKEARNHAHVFAVVKLPEEVWLPIDREHDEASSELHRLPPELAGFHDVFSPQNSKTLPPSNEHDHTIDLTPGAKVPYGPIYPLSQKELAELRRYLDENVKNGRIRESRSPAGAPILFVPKADGGLRLCVDYRGLNKVSVKNRYPLPLISEILDRLAGSKVFSKIDIQDAYYRIRIKEGDEWKTAFRTRYGHFEYTVMPFGLTNAPATFQNYIHTALHDVLDIFAVAYLDDVLIFSADRASHTNHLHQVLKRLRRAGLYAKPSKCMFYQDQVEFLGFVLSPRGVSVDPRRISDIASWELPKTYRDIQVFLGFCNFYRRFIRNYSGIALPLTALLKGSKNGRKPGQVNLNLHEKLAFRRLIAAFQSAPLLRHFDPSKQIRLETDASNGAMAGILSQLDEHRTWHPVAFWSRKFTGAETLYGTPDHELFAIVYSFRHWRHYLEGSAYPVEVFSDHSNLQTFMKQPRLNGRQARWCLSLTPFDFVIKHRAGKNNPADGPSRRWLPGDPEVDLISPLSRRMASESQTIDHRSVKVQWLTVSALTSHIPHFEENEDRDELIGAIDWGELGRARRLPNARVQPACASEQAYLAEAGTDLKELVGQLQDEDPETQRRKAAVESSTPGFKGWSIGPEGLLRFKERIYIPAGSNLRSTLLSIHHDDPLAGHFGRTRTLELMKRKYHWPNLDRDVAEYVQDCQICQGTTARRHKPYGELQPLPIPTRPFVELSMDFVTGLPPTIHIDRQVDAILVIVDRFTKWSLFFPVSSTITAGELAELFHNHVELRFGPPEGVVSDRGSLFTSKFWSNLCYLSLVRLRMSTAFHPQTDGQTERINQTLEHYLRCFTSEDQTNWPNLLKSAEFACNNAINITTGMSPFQALLGYSPDFRQRFEGETSHGEVPAASARIEKLRELRQRLKEHWRKATESMVEHYNKGHKPMVFKKGDLVGLSTKNLRLKGNRKLTPRFVGPFRVLQPIGKQAYRLSLPQQYDRLHNVFHISLLEPWRKQNRNNGESMPMPDLEDEDEYEVEEVRDEKEIQDETCFLVKWKGWPAEYNQWIPQEDMTNATEAIAAYRKQRWKGKPQIPKNKQRITTETRPRPKKSPTQKKSRNRHL